MDNVKNDNYYLNKMVADLEFMIEHTKGKTSDEIEANPLLMDSIMFRLVQIAENGEKLTNTFKELHKEIKWKAIKGMRNRIVHDYGFIDMTIVYDTITNSIPELYEQLKDLVQKTKEKIKMAKNIQSVEPNIADLVNGWLKAYSVDYKDSHKHCEHIQKFWH